VPSPPRTGRFLAAILGRASARSQVSAEIDFHVEMLVRDLVAGGMRPDAARAEAARRFGDAQRAASREAAEQRDRVLRRSAYLEELWQDSAHAIRQLRNAPAFTAGAALTLALGIGATTAIFGTVDSVVLRPFAFAHPERVVAPVEWWRNAPGSVSPGNFTDWRDQARAFSRMAAEQFSPANLTDGDTPERVMAGRVTSDFFPVFGVAPLIGRTFRPDEDSLGHDQVAVLSEGLWMRRFGADPAILHRTTRINGVPVIVVGVMPRSFDPSASGEELWMPLALTPAQRLQHDDHSLFVAGLLAPGVTLSQARAEMDEIGRRLAQHFPQEDGDRGVRVLTVADVVVGDERPRLLAVLGAVSFVLLIACGNVANLLLARGAARSKEIAIRGALGARRSRIVRQLLTESLVLTVLAAVAGVGLAWLGIRIFVASAPAGLFPRLGDTRIDGTILAFVIVLAAASAILSGLAPALRAARQDVQSALRTDGRGSGAVRDRLRAGLVVAEIALALTLLHGAGLLVRSAIHLDRTPIGFDPAGILTARLALPPSTYDTPDKVERAFSQILGGLRAEPRVRSAAVVSQAPMGPGRSSNGLVPEGAPLDARSAIDAWMRIVSPGYHGAMGIPIVAGRSFTDADIAGAPRVMIVSQALAARAWPGQDPVGKRIACCEGTLQDPRWKTVVGVAGDVRSAGVTTEIYPEFYLPVNQVPPQAWDWVQRTMTLVVRASSGDAAQTTALVRQAVRSVDPALPIFDIATMREAMTASSAEHRFDTLLLTLLALVGLLLSGAGIASVVAFFVSARTHEIGVRLALGATSREIVGLFARQSARQVLGGVVLGTAGAITIARLLRGLLYGVTASDPVTGLAVILVLACVASIATLVPALRATRVDPVRVLQ
jgi:putative ABC transport system permease protein